MSQPDPTHGPSPNPLDGADSLCVLGVRELNALFARRQLSPVEVAQAALARARHIDAHFNAFALIDEEGALRAARESERRWLRGLPLSAVDGVPTTLKEIVQIAGLPVRYGSHAVGAAPCAADAPSVQRLRGAGAVFLGITTTPEFGWKALTDSPLRGITRNPWNPALTPGGSSGGAAVAAACGAGVLHLGTDGGGSIRIPASFTGIAGLKPSYGKVAASPPSAFGTVAHIGPMARRADDLAAMLDAMAGRDLRDWTQGPQPGPAAALREAVLRGARIGFWTQPPVGRVDPEVAACVQAAVRRIVEAGAFVEMVELPGGDDLLEIFHRHWFSGAANRLASLDAAARATCDPGLLDIAAAGAAFSAPQLVEAQVRRAEFGAAMDALLERFDFLVSPAVAITAFEAGRECPRASDAGRWTEWAGFSFPVNLSQQPACSVPCGFDAAGLPIGLQIVGARGADGNVLAAAREFEKLGA
ncbi:MAG: amidase [Burkholderiales bacterium]|nr:amidase [Burkholderiales bacterium]